MTEENKFKQVICMEGPDASGKSSQVNLLSKKLKNCIVIHSPRYSNNTTKCFEYTMNTIYNKEFMDSITNPFKLNKSHFQKLIEALSNNIILNLEDRKGVCDIINSLYDKEKGFNNTINLGYFKDYMAYYNGIRIDPTDTDSLNNLFKLFKEEPEKCYVILDRFTVSGYCYNVYIPTLVINDYMVNVEYELSKSSDEKIISNCKYILWSLNYVKELLKSINKTYTVIFELDDLKNMFNMVTVYFKKSEILREIAKKTRENDAYDKENIIQEYSDKFYNDTLKTESIETLVDTDNLINKNLANKAEDICEYIDTMVYSALKYKDYE